MLNKPDYRAEILVIDDTPANLKVISEILSAANYSVAAVTNGKRALKRLQNYLPDLILLDIKMTEMDGFETCHHIKNDPNTAHIPIIFITALSDADSLAKGFSLGAVDYICKPFQELELLARVKTHLKMQSFAQALELQVSNRTADLQAALEKLEQSKLQLIQQEKMSSLGNLVAGVSHEINNPIGFLSVSIENVKDYISDLLNYVNTYQSQQPPNEVMKNYAKNSDLNFILEDLPKVLESMQSATDRIQEISSSLRTFSRADAQQKVESDIHEGIDSTLLILKYRLKPNASRPEIQVIRHYGELPLISCFPSQINQVFMNLLANAIDAFDEAAEDTSYDELEENPQTITIQTIYLSDSHTIQINIQDNGRGMEADVRDKIFDYLFTTKTADKGTGLGLAIAKKIIEKTHGGTLKVKSEADQGTKFCIHLPISEHRY